LPAGASSQTVRDQVEDSAELPAGTDVLSRARSRQAAFERTRVRYLPRTSGAAAGRCDEEVGRFCAWYEEGEWRAAPEAPEIARERQGLLAFLDDALQRLPHPWLLGQRIWYLLEAGADTQALAEARRCRVPSGPEGTAWCRALEGLVLHVMGRGAEADTAFARALARMTVEEAERWRLPLRPVEGRLRHTLEAARKASPDSLDTVLERVWALADPLALVPGNDRRATHYARWVASRIRERARNPYGIRWGRDLEELTLRHGWEVGWERSWDALPGSPAVVGHKHPQGKDFMPPARAVLEPSQVPWEDLIPDLRRPRSLYAPGYAPVFLPMDAQVAVFPRGDSAVVVATHFLPRDTTRTARAGAPLTTGTGGVWPRAGAWDGDLRGPVAHPRVGLFLLPVDRGEGRGEERRGRFDLAADPWREDAYGLRWSLGGGQDQGDDRGALRLEVPAGRYLLSVEHWAPGVLRAGRKREGLAIESVPPDVPALSDLLLVAPGGGRAPDLRSAAGRALPRPRVSAGAPVGLFWELTGLGWRPESLRFRLSLVRASEGWLRRVGRLLRLVGGDPPLVVSWEEAGPARPEIVPGYLEVQIPGVNPGRYLLRLEVEMHGRSRLTATRTLEVTEPPVR
ncbi:MAG: hypothetical protein ACE5GJ_11530, partial [Gemmatimonadota bacterium]